jgi:hypothetical protein
VDRIALLCLLQLTPLEQLKRMACCCRHDLPALHAVHVNTTQPSKLPMALQPL